MIGLIGTGLVLGACSNSDALLGTANGAGNTGSLAGTQFGVVAGEGGDYEHAKSSTPGGREVIKNPTKEQLMVSGPLPDIALGRKDAPVTVIKYASLTCPICQKWNASVFPKFKRAYIDTGKVRFILRQFPIGRASGNATIALRCAGEKEHFDLYTKYLDQQRKWVAQEVKTNAIYAVAAQVGLSRAKFDACMKDKALIDGLGFVKDRGRTLGIIGTPNFYIGGELVKRALTYEQLRAKIDPLLSGRVAKKN